MGEKIIRPESNRKHVVVVGGGIGGVFAAQRLKNADVDVTVIEKNTYTLFQPLLYQVAAGLVSPGEVAVPLRQIFRGQENINIVQGEVTDVDVANQVVTSQLDEITSKFEYDYIILAAGSGQSYFGNDHFAKWAPGLKTIDIALEIRSRFLTAFEKASQTDDPAERERLLTFVIVGAGPTGVELAGQFAEMADRAFTDEFNTINPASAKIILLDGAPQVLPPFGKRLGRSAQRQLEKRGVDVRLNAMVSDVDDTSVTYKDKSGEETSITTYTKVWSAGVQASSLGKHVADQVNAESDRAGRVKVNGDLTVGDKDNIFITGDMLGDGTPGLAQGAIQSGQYSAQQIIADVDGEEREEDFDYFDKGSMAIIARYSAVAKIGKVELTGVVAWLGWLAVHINYLTGFRNKAVTVLNNVLNIFSRDRHALIPTDQQLKGRDAMEELNELKN